MLHSEASVPTAFGVFRLRVYDVARDDGPIAIIGAERFGGLRSPAPLAHIHRACFLSENLGYTGCDCRERLETALETIATRGGVVVYLRRDADGRSVAGRLRNGNGSADHRLLDAEDCATAARVLCQLGVRSVRLIGDDDAAAGLAAHGITVAGQVRRPFIHVNFAVPLSCDADWQRVHELRERYDAVAVGAHTWNSDHPRLNVRPERLGREPRRQPARAVFAGRQQCPIGEGAGPLFLITARPNGCRDATVIPADGHDLTVPLEALYAHGIHSMLVEGGPTILRSFFHQELVDAVTVFVRVRDESSARDAARRALPFLPAEMAAETFGDGVLLYR